MQLSLSAQTRAGQSYTADTTLINTYLKTGDRKFQEGKVDSTKLLYSKAYLLARKIKADRKIADYISYQVILLNYEAKYKESLRLSEQMLEIGRRLKDSSLIANAENCIGNAYIYLGDYRNAAKYTLSALKIAQQLNALKKQQTYSNNLAGIFIELREKRKSLFYSEYSYKLARQLNDSSGIASSLVNLANSETINGRYDKAVVYYKKLVRLGYELKDLSYVLDAYINLANVSTERRNFASSLVYYRKAKKVLKDYPSPEYELYVYWGFAESLHLSGKDQEAQPYLEKSIQLAKLSNSDSQLKLIYLLASEIHESLKSPAKALYYRKQHDTLKDSLTSAEAQAEIHKYEIEYQTAEKEKVLAQQQLTLANNKIEIEQKNRYIVLALLAAVILASVAGAIYLIYRQRQKVHREKLKLVEKEKEVGRLEAMIEGEEKERARLARELHDGVGGILSATKLHLSILCEEYPELSKARMFEKSVYMLDSAAVEIRSIAHNLASCVLQEEGLSYTIESFCRKISNSNFKVTFYSLGVPERYRLNFELLVYRLTQECLNNIIKHAKAGNVLVQLSVNDGLLSLTVEDDGIGFDLSAVKNKGIGLSNLKSRVATMGGTFEISSSPSCGSTVYFEFDTTPYKLQGETIKVPHFLETELIEE